MKRPKYKDFPFSDVAAAAQEMVRQGAVIVQKWTCAGCGARLCGGPNQWTETGRCDEVDGKMGCGRVTDIRKQGCNYTIMILTPEARKRLLETMQVNLKIDGGILQ